MAAGLFNETEVLAVQEIASALEKTKANQTEAMQPDVKPERLKQLHVEAQVIAERREKLAADHPESVEVQHAAAAQALQAGNDKRGLEYADRAVALAEGKGEPKGLAAVLYTRAVGKMWAGDFPAAAEDAQRAMKLDPADKGARAVYQLSKGRAKGEGLREGSASPARRPLPDALEPESVLQNPEIKRMAERAADRQAGRAKLDEAMRALKLDDPRAALAAADAALRADPGLGADASMQRALAHYRLQDLTRALDELSKAIALWTSADKTDRLPSAYALRASLANKAGRPGEALQDADRALAYRPGLGAAHLERGRARRALGAKGEEFLADLRRAAELEPDFRAEYESALAAVSRGEADGEAGADGAPAGLPVGAAAAGGAAAAAALAALAAWTLRRRKPAAPASRRSDERVPRELDSQFDIVEPLGEGGMGTVYKGWDKKLKRSVAIKRLRAELQFNPRERERFIKEAELVASLRHPHIVEIYTILRDEQDTYLVFEHIVGRTVHELLHDSPGRRLPPKRALDILRAVADAVDHAHSRHVIHRDLKPANIMLGDGGWVKVMDFGIARQVQDSLLTTTNTIVGTPSYMAPEQALGAVVKESDVFALAVTFYEMLTGKLPFRGDGDVDKLEGRFAAVSAAAPELPAALDEVLARGLASRTDKRFASAMELYRAAAAVLDGRDPAGTPAPVKTR